MSDFLSAVVSFIIVLGPLILIHELGHFLACRMVGVTVLEFGLGFPPRAAKLFEQGGTEFTLNWLPLGGFVRPLGEDFVRPVGPEASDKDRARYAQYQAELEALGKKVPKVKGMMDANPWQRMFFLLAGSGMNFLAAIVILIIVATLGLPPIISGAAPNSPAAQAGLRYGDVITEINGQRIATAADVTRLLEENNTGSVNLVVDRSGEQISLSIDASQRYVSRQAVRVDSVEPGSPADGKFKDGDIILSVAGKNLSILKNIQDAIKERAGQPVAFVVMRDGEKVEFMVTPRENVRPNQGAVGISLQQLEFDGAYGLSVWDRAIARPFNEAVSFGLQQTGAILQQLILFPVQLVRGELTIEEARPVSVVGISQLGGQVVNAAIEDRALNRLLNFAALISLALGFTNLLPIPGLDGGRILFVIVEILRGKPMDPEREGAIHMVGLMIILGLFVLLVINDLVNPLGQIIR